MAEKFEKNPKKSGVLWLFYGYSMAILWLFYGDSIDIILLFCGDSMVIL